MQKKPESIIEEFEARRACEKGILLQFVSRTRDRRALLPAAGGLVGFVFHAFMFFSGAILYAQLAWIAAIFCFLLFWCSGRSETKDQDA